MPLNLIIMEHVEIRTEGTTLPQKGVFGIVYIYFLVREAVPL